MQLVDDGQARVPELGHCMRDLGRTGDAVQHAGNALGSTGEFARSDFFVSLVLARYGGGHARQALVQYLSADADRMLNGRYNDAVGRALFAAVSEATLLAAG